MREANKHKLRIGSITSCILIPLVLANCSDNVPSAAFAAETTDTIEQYLGEVKAKATCHFRTFPACAQVLIHKSGLVLGASATSPVTIPRNPKQDSLAKERAELARRAVWQGTPYPSYPAALGDSSEIRVCLMPTFDQRAFESTSKVVAVYQLGRNFTFGERDLNDITKKVQSGDVRIIDQVFEQEDPTDAWYVGFKNVWMHIESVITGSPKCKVDVCRVVRCFPNDWIDKPSTLAELKAIEANINDEFLAELHKVRFSGSAKYQMSQGLANALSTIFRVLQHQFELQYMKQSIKKEI